LSKNEALKIVNDDKQACTSKAIKLMKLADDYALVEQYVEAKVFYEASLDQGATC